MTEYEVQLNGRIAQVGDKFILRGNIYQTIPSTDTCTGCKFELDDMLCGRSPACDIHHVIYIKENS